jgi:hypothetical protein
VEDGGGAYASKFGCEPPNRTGPGGRGGIELIMATGGDIVLGGDSARDDGLNSSGGVAGAVVAVEDEAADGDTRPLPIADGRWVMGLPERGVSNVNVAGCDDDDDDDDAGDDELVIIGMVDDDEEGEGGTTTCGL